MQRRVQRYGWDQAAERYERGWQGPLAPAHERVLALAALQPGERVLDVACGTGLVTLRAAELVGPTGRVFGTDLSSEMVRVAAERARAAGLAHLEFARCDAEEPAGEPGTFDASLCALGLMYAPDPAAALVRQHEALRSGGRAVAAVWGDRRNCGWAAIFEIVDRRVRSEVCPLFFQLGTHQTLAHVMQRAGFAAVHHERFRTTLRYANAEAALEAAFAGGPVALAYGRFDEPTRASAHAEYLDSIAPFRDGEGYALPGEFVVARGEKAPSGPSR